MTVVVSVIVYWAAGAGRSRNWTELPPDTGHFGRVSLFGFGAILKHHWSAVAVPESTNFCAVMYGSSMIDPGLIERVFDESIIVIARLEPG